MNSGRKILRNLLWRHTDYNVIIYKHNKHFPEIFRRTLYLEDLKIAQDEQRQLPNIQDFFVKDGKVEVKFRDQAERSGCDILIICFQGQSRIILEAKLSKLSPAVKLSNSFKFQLT